MEPNKAVALTYDKILDAAPRIIAKGENDVAKRIIEIATQNQIAIAKDSELVEILSLLDLDSVIPVEAYVAVAEILNYVYKLDKA
jgi:flagellar biosynthesis protein